MTTYYGPGRYRVRITQQGFNQASTGTSQFFLKFVVLECVEPVNDSYEQHERTAWFAITEKRAAWTMRDLRSLGFDGDDFSGVDPRVKGFHSFIGEEKELSCQHEPNIQGALREKWGLEGIPHPLSRDGVKDLNKFLSRKAQQRTNSPPAEKDGLGITDADVPF